MQDLIVDLLIGQKLKALLFAGHRLLLWRLQPGLLVQDLSAVLEVIAERPLMSVKTEFRRRRDWFNIIIAMAFGPDVFKEGRKMLNAWLLASGAPCIWELKIEIGILIRDVLEHPTSWDLSLNVGISLSSLSAFYSGTLQSLAMMLMRPPSWDGLRELGDLLENKVSQGAGRSVLRGLGGMETADRDLATHLESLWILLMDFPAWILFALLSLFQKPRISGESYGKGVGAGISDSQSDPSGEKHVAWLSHQETAAQYIAWLFGPKDEKLRGLVVQMLMQVVQGWLHIKDEEIFRPVVKRRRLTTACSEGSCHAREEQKFVEEISVPEGLEGELRKKISRDHPDSLKGAYVAVQTWLLSFQDCCHILGDYSHGKTTAAIENKQQAKRRLVLRDMGGEATTVHDSQQSEAMCLQCKSFTFFDDLPLIALSCSPFLHSNVIVHLILHSVMVGSGFLSSKKDDYQAGRKGLAFKEPSHRTEDFRDACQEPFCLSFSHHASALKASGVSRVFRFLETLDLLEFSSFVNGSQGLGWLDSFKDAVARQLQMCMRSWSQHTSNTYSFALLDDLQQRASLWAARTGLESKTLKAFKQALQGLDIVIASSVVDDTF
ncbi:hypothetical protein L7F22_042612 [Adiantum nelumboides]|nr:hypothetical protein [Adiantum nelumboides]